MVLILRDGREGAPHERIRNMALTRIEKTRALKWFAKKNVGRGCPVCGKASFKVENDAAIFRVPPDQNRMMHFILIGCLKCGHLMMFNVAISKKNVIDDEDEEESEED